MQTALWGLSSKCSSTGSDSVTEAILFLDDLVHTFVARSHSVSKFVKSGVESWRPCLLFSKSLVQLVHAGPVPISVVLCKSAAGVAEAFEISSKRGVVGSEIANAHCARSNMLTPSQSSCRCATEKRQDNPGRECRTELFEECVDAHMLSPQLPAALFYHVTSCSFSAASAPNVRAHLTFLPFLPLRESSIRGCSYPPEPQAPCGAPQASL